MNGMPYELMAHSGHRNEGGIDGLTRAERAGTPAPHPPQLAESDTLVFRLSLQRNFVSGVATSRYAA